MKSAISINFLNLSNIPVQPVIKGIRKRPPQPLRYWASISPNINQRGKILPEAQRGEGLNPLLTLSNTLVRNLVVTKFTQPRPVSLFSWQTNPYTRSFFCSLLILWPQPPHWPLLLSCHRLMKESHCASNTEEDVNEERTPSSTENSSSRPESSHELAKRANFN